MSKTITMRRHVRFVETDAAGIVHYSNFFRFMEEAEIEFWKAIDVPVHLGGDCGTLSWPRVEAHCQYLHPLVFDDEFEVRLRVADRTEKALTLSFHIVKLDGDATRIVARGRIVSVCVSFDASSGSMKAVPIPPDIAARLDAAKTSTETDS